RAPGANGSAGRYCRHCTRKLALPLPFSAALQDGRLFSQEPKPAGGQLFTEQPAPSSPPAPKQFEKPARLSTSKLSPRLPTTSMLPLGLSMLTRQLGLCCPTCVPPGHSAGSAEPPLLLVI